MAVAPRHERLTAAGFLTLFGSLAAMWIVEAVNSLDDQKLDSDGIVPRTLHGLIGILTAPFLHASFSHLLANTIPFVVLGVVMLARSARELLVVLAVAAVTSGLSAWAISPAHTVIVGASGVVFGQLGFVLSRGFFTRSATAIAIAVVVAVVYGTALGGLLPSDLPVSWQGHLGGFIGGIATAALLPAP